ncbi:hypothetical protein [Sanyastnella coralliicola]|uniref:hypothetical protein n=1 Tax=Sanyastnella coralliicola TaxID=3069118 RepID=UPI0027BA176E|nr:hypothetical protein [Longitalea sp. SCSIO 12813]
MNKLFLVTLLSLLCFACTEPEASDSSVQIVDAEDLTPSPIRHDTLTEDQLSQITFIHESLYEVFPVSLEETITNFKRDQNPNREINVWLNMVAAYQAFEKKNSEPEKLENRQEAFKLILLRSMMPAEKAIKNSELQILTDDEIQEIMTNYQSEAAPITVE